MTSLTELEEGSVPKEAFHLDRNRKVWVLDNGAWKVGWDTPEGNTVWHIHRDVWSVLKQNVRVIQKFLGVAVDAPENGGIEISPNGLLPQIRDELQLHGEIGRARALAGDLTRLIVASQKLDTNPLAVASQVHHLKSSLSPKSRNPHKVQTIAKLMEGLNSDTLAKLNFSSLQAVEALEVRAREGVSIVVALFIRGGILVNWADIQDRKIDTLKKLTSLILYSAEELEDPRKSTEAWQRLGFLMPTQEKLEELITFGGNPYKQLEGRMEFKKLAHTRDCFDREDIAGLLDIAMNSYAYLQNLCDERVNREASGYYNKFRNIPLR